MLISFKLEKSRRLKTVIFGLLLLKNCLIFGQNFPDGYQDDKKIIVIDPGHGGMDSGAVGINGIKEKDVVLEVAEEMLRLNKTLFDGQLDIYLTRYRDTLISLSDRAKLAKALNVDVFVSLHCNHSRSPNAQGIEVYAHNSGNSFSMQSLWLGYNLQKGLNEKLGFKTRGVKSANFQVLREAGNYPAVLVELGFLSNRGESGYLLGYGNAKAIALTILMGLVNS